MKRKLSIIKNGYDVLRIIEMGVGEFKITNETGISDFSVYEQELFLKPQKIDFDNNYNWELSYHASTDTEPTKVHLKRRDTDYYKTLNLKHLIDPDINMEIPIPLFKILIPDVALKKRYKGNISGDKDHVVIDIGDNNSVEIFLTSVNFMENDYHDKWSTMLDVLMSTDIGYYATKSKEYINLNEYHRRKSNDDNKNPEPVVGKGAVITDNIGILLNVTNILDLNADKLTFLFIDNSEYLTFLANMKYRDLVTKQILCLYKYDFRNHEYFTASEIKKWENIFNDKEKQTNKLMKKYRKRLEEQIEIENKFNQERKELTYKCALFLGSVNCIKKEILKKYNLITDDEEKEINKDIISDIKFDIKRLQNIDLSKITDIDWFFITGLFTKQLDLTLLFCKYLEINTPVVFKYTIQSKKYSEDYAKKNQFILTDYNLKFEYVRLLYSNKYDIEMFRGVLNTFLNNKKENKILVCSHFATVEDYMKYGVSERLKLEDNFNFFDEGVYHMNEKQFEEQMKKNDNLLNRVYELIIKDIESSQVVYH